MQQMPAAFRSWEVIRYNRSSVGWSLSVPAGLRIRCCCWQLCQSAPLLMLKPANSRANIDVRHWRSTLLADTVGRHIYLLSFVHFRLLCDFGRIVDCKIKSNAKLWEKYLNYQLTWSKQLSAVIVGQCVLCMAGLWEFGTDCKYSDLLTYLLTCFSAVHDKKLTVWSQSYCRWCCSLLLFEWFPPVTYCL